MKNFFLFGTFLLMFTFSEAQQVNLIPMNRGSEYTARDANVLNNAQGSPFFEEQFTPGILVDTDSDSSNHKLYFRYNVISDQVQIKVLPSKNEIYVLPRQDRYKYRLKDYSYILENFDTSEGKKISGYVIQYFNGEKVNFFCKPEYRIIPGREAKTSFETEQPAKLEIDPVYYLQFGDQPLQEVKLKERELKEFFRANPEMDQYFKDHKIKEPEDVVKMLSYFEAN
ncbi:MAG: hypothetical protein WCD31_03845 [Gillisia sp.]